MEPFVCYNDGAEVPSEEEDPATETIRVLVRVRPAPDGSSSLAVDTEEGGIHLRKGKQNFNVKFDGVLDSRATQSDVYRHVQPAVDAALSGVNSTILAYGQTGAGKTHTLFGGLLPDDKKPAASSSADADDVPDDTLDGMTTRALRDIFDGAARRGARLAVSASFLEIYNESLADLLQPSMYGRMPLAIKEDSDTGDIFVRGLTEVPVHSAEGAMRLVRRALRQRTVRSTDMNARSSRSHGVLQLLLEQSSTDASAPVLRARLSLVDLAGSERVSGERSLTLDKQHRREMASINTSLSALASCIAALTQPDRTHVPYRDSLLTRLLQRSLGGNARTLLLAAVSPALGAVDETLSTLRFADRAKRVTLRATVNPTDASESLQQQRARYESHINRLQREVGRLKAIVSGKASGGGADPSSALRAQLQRLELQQAADRMAPPPRHPRNGWTGDAERGGGEGEGGEGSGGGGEGGGALSQRVQSLSAENDELRRALRARDDDMEQERKAHKRLQSALQAVISGSGDVGAALAAAGLGPAGAAAAAGGAGGAGGAVPSARVRHAAAELREAEEELRETEEEDALLHHVMAELEEQQQQLDLIRSEEREIELMLRAGGGRSSSRAPSQRAPGTERYRDNPDMIGHLPPRSPRQKERELGWVGVGGGVSAAATARVNGIARPREYHSGADPHSRFYDGRSDPNSKWYDPEHDPNSRWFRGAPQPATPEPGSSYSSARATPRSSGGGGTTPRGLRGGSPTPMPPRSAPAPPPPRPHGKRGNNRRLRDVSPRDAGAVDAAASALGALGGGADDMGTGSLYYVLGNQATRSRVRQLQQTLKQQARGREAPGELVGGAAYMGATR